jgi:hypothetical protein
MAITAAPAARGEPQPGTAPGAQPSRVKRRESRNAGDDSEAWTGCGWYGTMYPNGSCPYIQMDRKYKWLIGYLEILALPLWLCPQVNDL